MISINETKVPLSTIVKYKGVKVTSMIRAIIHSDIWSHLKLQDQNNVVIINNIYKKQGFLVYSDMKIIWKYYLAFVLKDFRYKNR